jgi:capsular polysaccharide transport system ATP-binding protein
MIRLRDVSKTYFTNAGSREVLRAVSFDLARGEKLGVLGRNGSGKSTLIRIMSGASRATTGRIERGMSISWPLAFGGAFQGSLTGRDNIKFISRVYGVEWTEIESFVEDFAELGTYLREPVKTYSSGMRARLAFALSLAIEFDCFLIDEVVAVGDARFQQKCRDQLFSKRSDRAMLIVSHDESYIREHCSSAAVLIDGAMSPVSPVDEALERYRAS